jgi:flagellum-specific peptidoglycan hydrolase FlgJ
VHFARKPTWQRATALVSLSTCGAMTGFSFTHGTVADMTSPTSMPVHLLEFKKAARLASVSAAASASASDSASDSADSTLRSAIVNVASYYLRMAQSKTPDEMEALIWQSDSVDGVDHGESCAAFASLTLELGAQAAGQESWVSGGTSYPWPLHQWADVRVDPNPDSPNVISVLQDAQAHDRWHPLGDGYQPQPGDWVLFDGHVEVVTRYAKGVLYTIGGDSLPNFSVNAHQYGGPLSAQGVVGFVNNGELASAASANDTASAARSAAGETAEVGQVNPGQAEIPGMLVGALSTGNAQQAGVATAQRTASSGQAVRSHASGSTSHAQATGSTSGSRRNGTSGAAAIPGLEAVSDVVSLAAPAPAPAHAPAQAKPARVTNDRPTASPQVPDTAMQQAFISQIAPGAMAAQLRYGIPAAVTIAQAIQESGWGLSGLAVNDHNLFGIKGTGPAGVDVQQTQEYLNGRWVTQTAAFKVYHNVAESIADHSQLLATGPSYQQAMADRHLPDAFATDLTGVYATDPDYGSNLIALMRLYNLYRYDAAAPAAPAQASHSSAAHAPAAHAQAAHAPAAHTSAAPQVPIRSGAPSQGGTTGQSGTSGRTGTPSHAGTAADGDASIPGVLDAYITRPVNTSGTANTGAGRASQPVRRPAPRISSRRTRVSTTRYVSQVPRTVTTDFIATAKAPLMRAEPLYADVANRTGIRWELLAACDWMQCKAQPRYSPVHGEKLGTANSDGTMYRTKSAALTQCANDLIDLAMAVYWIDITSRRPLSVRKLASVFAAFRWGGLLKLHNISAMEFPYSVEGLTAQHLKMRWPDVRELNAPDKPGSRFRQSFGAVPVVLSLDYPAVDE